MDQSEFKQVMVDLGFRKIQDADVKKMLDEADFNNDGSISW